MVSQRVLRGELLDRLPPGEDSAASLDDLVFINRFLGGHRILRSVFARLEARDAAFSVVDVGAASGDMGAALRHSFPRASVTSVDLVPCHLAAAAAPRVAGDVLALPFAEASFDYALCSLFLHHFPDAAATAVLRALLTVSRRGVVVIDLERSRAGSFLVRCAGVLFRWSAVTKHDSVRSVESAFRPAELRAFARAAGASEVCIRRHPAWLRVSMIARP